MQVSLVNLFPHREKLPPQLLLAKVRVTPVNGTTVPRAELQAMFMLTRILITAAKAKASAENSAMSCRPQTPLAARLP